jgi:DNA-binding NarL/FixJ family response regulator
MIRICIVDDHLLVAEGVAALIEAEPDMKVVARCRTVLEGLEALTTQQIDLALLDVNLGEERAFGLLDRLRDADVSTRVLIVAAAVTDEEVVRLAAAGVCGILLKDNPPALLLRAIRKVLTGEVWFSQPHLRVILRSFSDNRDNIATSGTTERERAVLSSLLEGCSNKEIAARLGVSETTIKTILQQLFTKHGVHNRSQLVLIALERYPEMVGS